MKKLKKLISDQAKDIRHRRHQINIHITLLGWMAEFSAFLLIIIGSFILGHGNVVVTLTLQSFTIFMMFNVVPCVYLMNEDDFKNRILESIHYFNFLRLFKIERNNAFEDENERSNENDVTQEHD